MGDVGGIGDRDDGIGIGELGALNDGWERGESGESVELYGPGTAHREE